MAKLIAILTALLFFSCSTARKVPEIDTAKLPAATFQGLGSKSLKLTVINKRKINFDAQNSKEVAAAVRRALIEALERGNLQVADKSPHTLDVEISDYDASDAEGECVKVTGFLKAKWGASLESQGYACHYLKHITGIKLGGNISAAYEKALKMMLDVLESNQMKLIGH